MRGKIIRGIAGSYDVNVEGVGILECKAKGIFRKRGIKPLPGDDVELEQIGGVPGAGNIIDILERRTELIRPAVANADQAVIVFAAAEPQPNFNLLDRFLVLMRWQGMRTIVCFNKKDQITQEQQERLREAYRDSGCQVLLVSARRDEGMDLLGQELKGRTTVLAGPSGVGKSSIVNRLFPEAEMETGSISEKIKRGRHTTRHSELFYVGEETYLFDTPGFSSLYLPEMEKEELKDCYPEFEPYRGKCRYLSCIHGREPECAVRAAVEMGSICKQRYENYLLLLEGVSSSTQYRRQTGDMRGNKASLPQDRGKSRRYARSEK
ncbi:MAG: ribosome small subunit-dependent GTPase A [Lachnospiraceae bacterium]|nr:ribosome small subunit-dependent GTPase A [Lachnospiraceae bacterium]